MTATALLGATALGLSAIMAGAWALQRRTGQSGWIDATWSFALGAAGAALALAPIGAEPIAARQWIVAAFAIAGALRLGAHIVARSLNAGEDPRYHALAVEWGADFPRRLFWFLQIQAACAFLLSLTMFLAARNPAPFGAATEYAGAALLGAAILGEAWSDATLARFRKENAGRAALCERGPWAFSRHPNYFFQWLAWVGYAAIALDLSGQWPQGWLALLGPAFIYYLLAHVSGAPPLERHMLATRGDAYRAYQARVNVFFPGPRKGP